MAKKSAANFFLEKGEKLILGVGVLVTGLLLLLGVSSLLSATDTSGTVKTLEGEAKRVTGEVNNTASGTVDPLPDWAVNPPKYIKADAGQFPLTAPPFEPVHQPNMLRENPTVLMPVAAQMDSVRGPMRALDVKIDSNGETLIGVLVNKPTEETNRAVVIKATKDIARQARTARERFNQMQRRPVQPQPQPNPTAPPGGMAMSSYSGPISSGGRGGPGRGGPAMGGGMPGFGGVQRDDQTVRYMSPLDAEKGQNPLAETVAPLEAVLVQAAFPIEAQLREIRRALRLRSNDEAMQVAQGVAGRGGPPVGDDPDFRVGGGRGGPPPGMFGNTLGQSVGIQFAGFDVERKVTAPTGAVVDDWSVFPHEDLYFTKIGWYSIASEADDGYLLPFLRYDQRITAPLPQMAENLARYPGIRIPQIVDAITKMKAENVPVPTASEFENRFKNTAGDANPYMPRGQAALGGAVGGTFGPPPGMFGPQGQVGGPPPGMFGPGGMGRGGQVAPGGQPLAPGMAGPALPTVDYAIIRFFDPDVEPGYTYEYRIRVKMRNPNFGDDKGVQRKEDAKQEILTGSWWQVPGQITVPDDSFMYAYDTGEYVRKAEDLAREVGKSFVNLQTMRRLLESVDVHEGRRAVVQVQQWVPQVRASGSNFEPVGTWIVAEMPVAPGEYIGRRQLIKLPLWSSSAGAYALRELAGGVRVAGLRGESNQPKGWPVSFRTGTLLLDFDGGQVKTQAGNRELKDESATELLVMDPDGKLKVMSSAADMADQERIKHDKTWIEWIDRVKNRVNLVPQPGGFGGQPAPGPGGNTFNRDN